MQQAMVKQHFYQTWTHDTVFKLRTQSPTHCMLQKVRFLIYKCNISQAFLRLMAVNPDSCALSGIIQRFLLW